MSARIISDCPDQTLDRAGAARTAYAVVDSNELLIPQQTKHAGRDGDTLQGSTHARTFGVAETIYIIYSDSGFCQGVPHEPDDPCPVMLCGVLGKKAFSGRGNESMADVGEDLSGAALGGMQYHADSELVGRTLKTKCNHDGASMLLGQLDMYLGA